MVSLARETILETHFKHRIGILAKFNNPAHTNIPTTTVIYVHAGRFRPRTGRPIVQSGTGLPGFT